MNRQTLTLTLTQDTPYWNEEINGLSENYITTRTSINQGFERGFPGLNKPESHASLEDLLFDRHGSNMKPTPIRPSSVGIDFQALHRHIWLQDITASSKKSIEHVEKHRRHIESIFLRGYIDGDGPMLSTLFKIDHLTWHKQAAVAIEGMQSGKGKGSQKTLLEYGLTLTLTLTLIIIGGLLNSLLEDGLTLTLTLIIIGGLLKSLLEDGLTLTLTLIIIGGLLKSLLENGHVKLDGFLPMSAVERAYETIGRGLDRNSAESVDTIAPGEPEPSVVRLKTQNLCGLPGCKVLCNPLVDESFAKLVKAYLGSDAVLGFIEAFRLKATQSTSHYPSGIWHHDRVGRR